MDRETESDGGITRRQPLRPEPSGDGNRRDSLVEIVTYASRCLSDSFRSFNDRSRYEPLTDNGAPSGPDNDQENSLEGGLHNIECSDGRSLADAICIGGSNDLEHAKAALLTAVKHKLLVNLRDEKGTDLLRISIGLKNYEATWLILESLSNKCTSLEETIRILTENILDLEKHFPDLLQQFIIKNKFCHELCRFSVPSQIFNSTSSTIIATSDTLPSEWTPSKKEAKQLWMDMHPDTMKASTDTSHGTVMAALHLVSIEDIAKSKMSRITNSLLVTRVPVEFFNSKMVKWLVYWKWIQVWRFWLWMFFLLDFILIVCFSAFAYADKSRLDAIYWNFIGRDENGVKIRTTIQQTVERHSSPSHLEMALLMASLAICILFFAQETILLTKSVWNHGLQGLLYFLSSPWSWVKIACCVLMIVLSTLAAESYYDRHRETVVAAESIFVWITVLYYAQPFKYTGPLVATVQAVLFDTIPFLALGLVVLLGFSFASFSLKNQGYRSLLWSIQSLFYALLGEFDYYADEGEQVNSFRTWCYLYNRSMNDRGRHQPTECDNLDLLEPVDEGEDESVTRHVFLDVYVLFEGIVLLTLLYTIMSDTHDRVKINAKAHLTRFRAMIVNDCEFTFFRSLRQRTERKTKRYLYVLKPVDKKNILRASMKWKGRLKKTERITKNLLHETTSEILTRLEKLETKQLRLENLETKLEELLHKQQGNVDSQNQMSSTLRDLQEVVIKLDQFVTQRGESQP